MSEKIFCFDPAKYADHFAKEGYVHIRGGVTQEFYDKMVQQVDQKMKSKLMKEFAIGDKQQAMYEFPEGANYAEQVCESVGAVCGLPADQIVLSERHVKGYEANADANPKAHKDRFASEISLGLSVHVKEGSTLVLYPYDENDINPFNTSVQLRASMSPDQYPEPGLAKGRKIEIKDAPRDVIMFRGHKIWHLRSNPALTTMLYLKLNSFNCDPLGEDRNTPRIRENTAAAIQLDDKALETVVPTIGRRVDYFHKYFNRDWNEIPGVVLWGEKHFSVDDQEWAMLRAIDGKRTVRDLITASETPDRAGLLAKVRRLATRGVIELVK